jgi:hypothetical protein
MKEVLKTIAIAVAVIALIVGVIALIIWGLMRLADGPKTYCTSWVKAIEIKPSYEDNGKHEDEQYVVKYEDGSVQGYDQGNMPFARCTNKVEVHPTQAKDEWKTVDYDEVDWES